MLFYLCNTFWLNEQEGEPPCQIISPLLQTGYQIRRDVSNGATNVLINGREITNRELWLLWVCHV